MDIELREMSLKLREIHFQLHEVNMELREVKFVEQTGTLSAIVVYSKFEIERVYCDFLKEFSIFLCEDSAPTLLNPSSVDYTLKPTNHTLHHVI